MTDAANILHGLFLTGRVTARSSADRTENERMGTMGLFGTEHEFLMPCVAHPYLRRPEFGPEMGKVGKLWEGVGKFQSHFSHRATASVYLIWTAALVWVSTPQNIASQMQ